MSIDSSLKTSGGLAGHRNVLKRDERIAKLVEEERFDEGGASPLGLPKVGNRKISTGKKAEKKGPAEEGAVEGAEGATEGAATPAGDQ